MGNPGEVWKELVGGIRRDTTEFLATFPAANLGVAEPWENCAVIETTAGPRVRLVITFDRAGRTVRYVLTDPGTLATGSIVLQRDFQNSDPTRGRKRLELDVQAAVHYLTAMVFRSCGTRAN